MKSIIDRIDEALVREGMWQPKGGLISWRCSKCSNSNKARNRRCQRCGSRMPKEVRRK